MNKYIQYFKKTKFIQSAFILFLLSVVLKVILMPLGSYLLSVLNLKGVIYTSVIQIPDITPKDFFVGVILAPIIETLIGQYLPLSILSKLNFSSTLKIVISSLFFSLLHFPVVEFIPSAFGVGVCLSIGFLSRYEYKKKLKEAFLLTCCIHFLHNLFAFIVVYFSALIL